MNMYRQGARISLGQMFLSRTTKIPWWYEHYGSD